MIICIDLLQWYNNYIRTAKKFTFKGDGFDNLIFLIIILKIIHMNVKLHIRNIDLNIAIKIYNK